MKAFILAAGYGERLRPITNSIPKPLIKINNYPSICYSLMLLKEAGIREVMCNLHYMAGDIVDFFEKNNFFNMDVMFSFEDEILGTGGGLKKCENFFHDDDFVIINSDIISDIFLADVIDLFYSNDYSGVAVLQDSSLSGTAPVASVNAGRIVDFKNFLSTGIKPLFDYMGIAVLSPLIFNYLKPEFSSVVYTGFTELIKGHSLGYYSFNGAWKDIGGIDALNDAEKYVKDSLDLQKRMKRIWE